MKRVWIAIAFVVILALVGIGFLYQQHTKGVQTPLPRPTATATQIPSILPSPIASAAITFCNPADLKAQITEQGAAGNIYGTLVIKNTASSPCQIIGNDMVQAHFSAKNIAIKQQGQLGAATITLAPNQSVYSQIHYPNGPQCQGPTTQSLISFTYEISPGNIVTFTDQNGKTQQQMPVCQDATVTQVDVWGLSEMPITR